MSHYYFCVKTSTLTGFHVALKHSRRFNQLQTSFADSVSQSGSRELVLLLGSVWHRGGPVVHISEHQNPFDSFSAGTEM